MSCGMREAGWVPVAGVDANRDAVQAYAANFPEAEALQRDLSDEAVRSELVDRFGGGRVDALVGGPPCQGFSRRNLLRKTLPRFEEMNRLPRTFAELAVALDVKVVVMEEVRDAAQEVLPVVTSVLEEAGFEVQSSVLDASRHGVPQKRMRMILVATKAPHAFRGWPEAQPALSAGEALARLPLPEPGYKIERAVTLRHIETLKATRAHVRGNFGILKLGRPSPTIHTKTYPGAGPYVIERGGVLRDERAGSGEAAVLPSVVCLSLQPEHRPPADGNRSLRSWLGGGAWCRPAASIKAR